MRVLGGPGRGLSFGRAPLTALSLGGLAVAGIAAWPLEGVLTEHAVPPGPFPAAIVIGVALLYGLGAATVVAVASLAGLALAHPPRLTAAVVVLAGLLIARASIGHGRAHDRSFPPERRGDVGWLAGAIALLALATALIAGGQAALDGSDVLRTAAIGAGAGAGAFTWVAAVAGARDALHRRSLEALALVLVLALGTVPDFTTRFPPFLVGVVVLAVEVPRLDLAAAALGPAVAVTGVIAATARGHGLYAGPDTAKAVALVCAFGSLITALILTFGVVVRERRRQAERLARLARALQDGVMEVEANGRIAHVNDSLGELVGLSPSALRGRAPPYPFMLDGGGGPGSLEDLMDLARRSGAAEGRGLVRAANGTPVPVEWTVLGGSGEGSQSGCLTVVLRDVSEIVRGARHQQALAALMAQAESEPAFERFSQLALDAVRSALGADAAALVAREPEDSLALVAATADLGLEAGHRLALQGTVAAQVMSTGEPAIVDDVEQPEHERSGDLFRTQGLRSAIIAPVCTGVEGWGVLQAVGRDPGMFEASDLDFLSTVARLLSDILTRAAAQARDSVSGLPNRIGIVPVIAELLPSANGVHGGGATILAIELELRPLVVSLGYEGVETVVTHAVERIGPSGQGETLARLSFDTLVLVSPGLSIEHATLRAQSVRSALSDAFEVHDNEVVIGCSVGIAAGRGGDATELIHNAVAAARRARWAGGIAVFRPEMRAEALARLQLEADLRRALAVGAIELHYQPIINLSGNQFVAFEALARWPRAEADGSITMISPGQFVPLAEETGLIGSLGRHVLSTACHEVARWNELRGDRDLAVSVNLSARDLTSTDFVPYVASVIEHAGIEPDQLSLELTESALLHETPAAAAVLTSLRGLGVWLILDDFGTGFASLSMLKRLLPRVVKLDRSFITGGDQIDETIVAATVSISDQIAAGVVAEGVETAEQLHRVSALGCRYVQGFLVSPAVPPEEAAVLAGRRTASLHHEPAA